ncbi:MAG: glycosyltransferase family 4 protein [Muribaculum sp.]|nr:glycosyltransferase family 4 protein [Muribaculum sp.]
MKKLIRICTVPQSLGFIKPLIPDFMKEYNLCLVSSSGNEWKDIKDTYPDVKCIEVPIERRMSVISDLKSVYYLVKVFRKERPDIVHSMTGKSGILSMLAARICGVPYRIHTFTGLLFPTAKGFSRFLFETVDKITCKCATHIIPEGEGVKNDLLKSRITNKTLKVLGYGNVKGIDLEYFDKNDEIIKLAKELNTNDYFTFVFVGRLLGDKGINELIEAFVMLEKEFNNVQLILVGPDEQSLDPLSEETNFQIKTNPHIKAVGAQKDVRVFYAAADVAVLPSYREGFPNCVLEAGAMGLPQIVTDINGSREIINHEENGLIVPPQEVTPLYEAMKRMILDKELLKNCASNARHMISSRFEQNYVKQCLLEYYREITSI